MSQKTSLHDEHVKLGATIVDFAGWQMPVRYKSIKDEVKAVRQKAGMFDVSHMGEFFFEGPDANRAIDYLMTNDFLEASNGKAVYSPLCDDEGKIIDDAIGYKLGDHQSLLCVNASNIEKDKAWIQSVLKEQNFDCSFEDKSPDYSLIALQGPESEKVLSTIINVDLSELEYYGVKQTDSMVIARTGYTGEDGFEIFATHELIQKLWTQLIDHDVVPCGLASRDVLRLEVAYPLYGQDLTQELTPLDCNLKWTVKPNKEAFSGKQALSEYTAQKRLIKMSLEKGIPRSGQLVFQGDQQIGTVTSGTLSVTNGHGVCLALVDKQVFNKDEIHFLEIRGKKYPAQFTTKPFVNGGHK